MQQQQQQQQQSPNLLPTSSTVLDSSMDLTSLRRSRSSTMPGYSVKSRKQQQQQQRSIDPTGWSFDEARRTASRDEIDDLTPKRKSNKSKDAMYQLSYNVPDSLVQFSKELHQVRAF
jgi:hypothetical protein